MGKKVYLEKYSESTDLNAGGIDKLSELVSDSLSKAGVEHKNTVRLRLAVEDVLLLWSSKINSNVQCNFRCGERFGRSYITVAVPGPRIDPYEMAETENTEALYSYLFVQSGLSPAYSYVNGENRLTLNPPKPQHGNGSLRLILTILAALLVGYSCKLLPQGTQQAIQQIADPIFKTLSGIMTGVAGPLIFLSICMGIISIGNVTVLNRIGKTVIFRYLIRSLLCTSLIALCSVWFFNNGSSATEEGSGASTQILSLLLSIVPSNIFTPFTEGNTLQIIFLAFVAGIIILILGDKVNIISSFIKQCNSIVQIALDFMGQRINLFVFICVFTMILSGAIEQVAGLLKGVIVLTLCAVVFPTVYIFIVSIRLKVSFAVLVKKILPSTLIALSTGSSAVALPSVMDNAENNLGIEKRIISFSVPLGQMVFCVGTYLCFILLVMALAEVYGFSISLPWIITMVISVTLLGISAPPTQTGGLAVLSMLLLQAGIPAEALAIAIAWNAITNSPCTGTNVACLQAELILIANKLGVIDKNVLKSKV